MDAYRAADVRLYALSYDEPDALADYAAAHDTTFTMLSDPDSEVIRSFGILNTLIPPDDHPWYGLPFPGSYVVDADGTIVAKFFELLAPPTSPLTLAGSGETLQTYEGDVVLRLPVAQNARQMRKDDDGRYVTISGRVRWQACDDVECFGPESMPFSFRVEAGFPVLGDMGPGVGRVPAMNGAQHFQRLIDRRASDGPSADDE